MSIGRTLSIAVAGTALIAVFTAAIVTPVQAGSIFIDLDPVHNPPKKRVSKPARKPPATVIHRGPVQTYPSNRHRVYRDVQVARPHGHWFPGFGRHTSDARAFKWIAFTAITLAILDNLSEDQQRAHEDAQIQATEAQVGETIEWNEQGASGAVTVVRDGTSTTGRYCREFQQDITIAGRRETAFGTACQNNDGTWEVVSTSSP